MYCISIFYKNKNCPKLVDVQLPESLVEIDACCFNSCYDLKEIFLPKNVRIIGFSLCLGKATVDTNNNYLKSISNISLFKTLQFEKIQKESMEKIKETRI
mgnify:CR=1 FL=1